MNLLGRLALLFVLVPLLELVVLIQVGQWIGLLPTLLLVVLTGVTGAWLARAEGLRVFFRFQKELEGGRLPGQPLLDGLAVLVGGAFLLTPGILTDVAGFSLLLPPSRRWIQRRVRARLERSIAEGSIRVVGVGPAGFWSGMGGAGPGGRAHEDAPESEGGQGGGGPEVGRHPPGTGPRGAGGSGRGRSHPRDPYEGRDPSKGIEVGGDPPR
jgi:UPF0716 protein FxsA